MRFLGMLAIYIGHYGELAGKLYLFVFSYHVPLFFFAAGFFFRPIGWSDFGRFVLKMVKRLLLPYLAFCLLYIIVGTIYQSYGPNDVVALLLKTFVGRRNNTPAPALWFLPCLFAVNLVYAFLLLLLKHRYIVFGAALVLYFLFFSVVAPLFRNSTFFSLDYAVLYLVYFSLGHCLLPYINRVKLRQKTWYAQMAVVITMVLLTLVAAGIYFYELKPILNWLPVPFLLNGYRLIITVLLLLFQCGVAKILVGLPFIHVLGQNTLVLCGCESTTRILMNTSIALIGLSLNYTPLSVVIYALASIVSAYFIFGVFFSKVFPVFLGKPRV